MAIYLYNSLTKKKEEFIPLESGQVNMYTCGVTVYDDCHIGHLRSLYIFDVIRSYLEFRGFKVKFVRNITDIDDKIIKRAQELKVSWQEVVENYIQSYQETLKLFNIRKADFEPRATEHIDLMIKNIEKLIEKGFAYITESGVYFKVKKFPNYGKLSGQKIEKMLEAVRIEPDETKDEPLDFALWKFSKPNEPFWNSPWGKGRPGWHIECSTMAIKYLGQTLDIHGGGMDLIFPHHENEIAQSEALTGKPFAKYWLHHGLLTLNGQKMAKSLGNFITAKEILKNYSPEVLKLFFLSCHYSHPIDFNWDKLKDCHKSFLSFINLMERIESLGNFIKIKNIPDNFIEIDRLKDEFITAMDDDFNTAKALGILFKLLNLIDGYFTNFRQNLKKILYAKEIILSLFKIFGISIEVLPVEEEILKKIKLREELRRKKDFLSADKIRKELEERGIILEDTPEGTIYRRK